MNCSVGCSSHLLPVVVQVVIRPRLCHIVFLWYRKANFEKEKSSCQWKGCGQQGSFLRLVINRVTRRPCLTFDGIKVLVFAMYEKIGVVWMVLIY